MTVRAEIRPIPQPPREVVLTMPYDVAVTLRSLAGSAVGCAGSYRDDADAIHYALSSAGVCFEGRRFKNDIEAAPRPSHKD